ncbi:MAG TPA: MFS transporter [Chloroflexia bacterium]|nr:MFS transporter [Chloroflexia bacterium]
MNRRQLFMLAASMFAAMVTLTLPVVQVQEFVGRLLSGDSTGTDLVNTAKGLFVSAHFAAYIPFAFVWGGLSDRRGKRKPFLLIGLLGQALMFLLMPLINDLWLLYAARFVEGAFSIATVSMLMTIALDTAPPSKRGMALGVFTMGMLLGNATGVLLGGILARASYQYPFWAGSALLFLVVAMAIPGIKEPKTVTPARSFGSSMRVFREHPRLMIPYGFTFLDRLTVGFFVSQFSILAAEVYEMSPAARGSYLGIFLLCFALLSPLGGMLSDRFGRVLPILVGTVIYGLVIMLVGRVSPEILYLVMAAGGISGAVLYPPSIAMVGDYAGPGQRGVAMGGFNLAGSIGYTAGPLIFGIVADGLGQLATPLVAGALCLVAVAVTAPILLRAPRARQVGTELGLEPD